MAIDKNKIAAPVAITDPYNLLGIYPKNGVWDVADIVALERPLLQGGRPGRINKWSRHKPVRYPQAAPLSENYPQQSGGVTTYVDQWEGSETDKNQVIRYGLKATIPHGTNIVAIHDTSFDYVAYPHPGTDFCRLSDFDGYDAIAPIAGATGKYYKLEGYLFPDTYDFYKGEEIDSVVGKLVYNFQNRTADLEERIAASGMTLDQIVTMASIIQREAANTQDMANVSAVLHNRLDFGGEYGIYRLECDSTIYYPYQRAEDVPETGALSYGNYDTYEVQGLPAGAICNPGLDAIEAALNPNTEGDAANYLYFCHAADGTAYYATNADDHAYNMQLAGLTE